MSRKQDVYPFAGDFTTTAQAEGAIDGTASDYEVRIAFATEFAFSRFNAARDDRASVEGSKATDVVDASSIERVADPAAEEERRRLSEASCPPPLPPPPLSPSAVALARAADRKFIQDWMESDDTDDFDCLSRPDDEDWPAFINNSVSQALMTVFKCHTEQTRWPPEASTFLGGGGPKLDWESDVCESNFRETRSNGKAFVSIGGGYGFGKPVYAHYTYNQNTREKKFIEAVNCMQYKRMILTPDDCREVVECANEFFRGSDYQYPAGGPTSASQKMLYQPPLEIAGFEYRARWDNVVRTGIDTASGVVPPLKLGVRDNHYTAPIRESHCPDCGTCIFMTRRGDIGPLYVPPFVKGSFQIVECPCSSQTVPSAAAGVRDTSPGCVEWTPASATEPMCAVGPQNALYEPACASQPTQGGMVGTFWDDGF